MSVIEKYEKSKNKVIYDSLTKLEQACEDKETFKKVRVMFLDAINKVYNEGIYIIAMQEGIAIQNVESLAEQLLPKNYTPENDVKNILNKRETRTAGDIAGDKKKEED